MSSRYRWPQRLTIPRVKEARLSLSYSTISTDTNSITPIGAETPLSFTGAGGLEVTGTEGSPDALVVQGTGPAGAIDHGGLSGRDDDDHTQYLLINGTRAMTGNLLLANGTEALPAISFSSDPDTGFYRTTTNQIGMTAGGSNVANFSSAGVTTPGSYIADNGSVSLFSAAGSPDGNIGVYEGIDNDGTIAAYDTNTTTFLYANDKLKIDDPGNLIISKTTGVGIKVDTAAPTFGFRDLLGFVNVRNTGASKPVLATYRDSLLDYQFQAGDEEYINYHLPHDYLPGSDMFIHIHWSHTSATVTGGGINMEFEATYSKGYDQDAFPASTTTTLSGVASTTQYQKIITEVQLSTSGGSASLLDTDNLEIDGVIISRFKVVTNNIEVSSGGVPDPFIHYIDIHYQSTCMSTKDKNFPFYT